MIRFSLPQIEAFVLIARLGSFSAAANRLGLTQPSVSQRIADLEIALGAQLFHRNGPKIAITASGKQFQQHAERIIDLSRQAGDQFSLLHSLAGRLNLGVSESFAVLGLVDLLRRLEDRYPDLEVSAHVDDTAVLSRMLDDDELDLAVVSEPRISRDIVKTEIGMNRFEWIAPYGFGAREGAATPVSLSRSHLILTPPTSTLYQTVTNWFSGFGLTPSRTSTCNSLSAMVQMVRADLGVSIVPRWLARQEAEAQHIDILELGEMMPAHRVFICQSGLRFGGELRDAADLIRAVAEQHEIFVPS